MNSLYEHSEFSKAMRSRHLPLAPQAFPATLV